MAARLTDEKVMQIRLDRQRGDTLKVLADKYHVNQGTVSRIVRGESHAHLPVLMTTEQMQQGQRAVTDDQLRDIVRRWRNGENMAVVAEEYGLALPTLSNYISRYNKHPDVRNERVQPDKGSKYRDALLKIAEMGDLSMPAVAVARKALGLPALYVNSNNEED